MTNFLIHYNRKTAEMACREIVDRDEAARCWLSTQAAKEPDAEVVLLHANDLSTIQQTHSRYFMGHWRMLELVPGPPWSVPPVGIEPTSTD